jgi:hypothetical protein
LHFFALNVITSLKIHGAVIPRNVFTQPGSTAAVASTLLLGPLHLCHPTLVPLVGMSRPCHFRTHAPQQTTVVELAGLDGLHRHNLGLNCVIVGARDYRICERIDMSSPHRFSERKTEMRNARNEKRHPFCSVVVLGLSLLASTACWAQSTRTIGGNAIVKRAGHDSIGGNFFVVDTNQPFTADGDLTNWEIFAETTNPIELVIYRNQGGSIVEVGRSGLVTPTIGYNLFSLTNQPKINVL